MYFQFGDHALDVERRELRRGAALIAVEPQVFDLLVYLLRNRDRVVSKDDLIEGVWHGRIVSESTLTSRINAARKAVGDNGEDQTLIRTFARKGIRFVGAVEESDGSGTRPRQTEAAAAPAAAPTPRQEIRFCTASDGVRIAYALAGQGPPLVKAANWLNHLEYDWQSPIWSHLLHALAADHRLIRYDERGNGLSDWEVDDISFEVVRARSRERGGRDRARALRAVRDFARVLSLDRLRGAQPAPRQPSGPLRRLCARPPQAELRCVGPAGGCLRHPDARRLGQGKSGVPADVDITVHPRRYRRADAVVQRPATHHDLPRECAAHPARIRRHRRDGPSVPGEGADPGAPLPRRCRGAVRRRAPHGGGHSGRAVRGAGGQQSPDPRRRAGVGTVHRGNQRLHPRT